MNELRELDNKTVVLYSDEREIIAKASARKKCFKIVPYRYSWREKPHAYDLYFPRKEARGLCRLLGMKFEGLFTHTRGPEIQS